MHTRVLEVGTLTEKQPEVCKLWVWEASAAGHFRLALLRMLSALAL